MDLTDLRQQIDEVDKGLLELFQKRMEVVRQIGQYKQENGLPVYDAMREREKLCKLTGEADENMQEYVHSLYSLLFELSRTYQRGITDTTSKLGEQVRGAIESTEQIFPRLATVACQGVAGAYSQLACDRLFSNPSIMYTRNFEGVFAAVDAGLCRYGVLPLENSTAGSVNRIYDLMMKYNFHIVRSVKLKVDHNLLVRKGTRLEDVKEIFSHEQAITQCSGYLKSLGDIKVTVCENTAVAAKMVAESGRTDIAALSSRSCAVLYGLECLSPSVQDKGNNYTRFICISKKPEIYPGADKTSIMLVISHRPGALYELLQRFFVLGINLVKLESRPIPDRDFEFMFYFDLETSVYSDDFIRLLCELDESCEEFKYLGSYSEIA